MGLMRGPIKGVTYSNRRANVIVSNKAQKHMKVTTAVLLRIYCFVSPPFTDTAVRGEGRGGEGILKEGA
jgi:hypothetical protein